MPIIQEVLLEPILLTLIDNTNYGACITMHHLSYFDYEESSYIIIFGDY
jgi:hypothetical protein